MCPLSEHCDLCSLDKASVMDKQKPASEHLQQTLFEETELWYLEDEWAESGKGWRSQNYRENTLQVCGSHVTLFKDDICWR